MKMFQLRCPCCDAVLNIEDDIGTVCYCKYCGTRILLEDQQDRVIDARVRLQELEHEKHQKEQELNYEKFKIEKEYEDKDKERKTNERSEMIPFYFLAAIVIFALINLALPSKETSRIIPVPYSSFDFCKMNYEDAVEILEEAGFEDIYAQGQEASGLMKNKKISRVKSISIDGDKVFLSGKEFSSKSKVIITYHSES